jgi:HSP20 family protein
MVMRRTNTLHPARQLRDEMDRLFSDFFPAFQPAANGARGYPALNVWENDDNVFCEAEVPGLKQEWLDISLMGNELTIRGQRTDGAAEQSTFHRRERNLAGFERTLRLPVDVDGEHVEASMHDGVLLITLPKAKAARPRKISIKAQ